MSLAGNRITDKGLSLIVGMTRLKSIDLAATEVTDAGLNYLERIESLEWVNLGATHVTSEGVAAPGGQAGSKNRAYYRPGSRGRSEATTRSEPMTKSAEEFAHVSMEPAGESPIAGFKVRPARIEDAELQANLVFEQAVHEKLEQHTRAIPDDFPRHLFGFRSGKGP